MKPLNSFAIGAGLAVVAIGAAYLLARKAGATVSDAAAAVGTAVNPVSDQNLAYKGVNAVGSAVTGDQSFSLGGWIYDLTHPAGTGSSNIYTGVMP